MAICHIKYFAASTLLMSLLVISCASDEGYGSLPKYDQPKPGKDKLLSTIIGIQGIVYCQSGYKRTPLEGAVARITCLGVDKYGYETAPFSILSGATDEKGYFIATLSPNEVQDNCKIKECKAFLELSPSETCKYPTNVNKGVHGALLASYKFLTAKKMKLFTVGPFFYSTEPQPTSNGRY